MLKLSSSSLYSISMRNASTVGFIGIGNMGTHMVVNLLKNGHSVKAYDIDSNALKGVVEKGAKSVKSVADAVSDVDFVFTMLPTPEIVKETFRGTNGIIANAKKGTILMDSSTVGPDTPIELEPEARKNGLSFIDAPVTGAVPAARDGTLTFLVGGTDSQCKSVEGILKSMGKHVVHCGPTGSGQSAKVCNNMCLAINMISTAETLGLAKRLGLDAKLMTNILNISSGRSWCSEVYNPVPNVQPNVPSNSDYDFGFQVGLIAKDLGLAQLSASKVKAPLPLGGLAFHTYLTMGNNGYNKKDFSSVYKFFSSQN